MTFDLSKFSNGWKSMQAAQMNRIRRLLNNLKFERIEGGRGRATRQATTTGRRCSSTDQARSCEQLVPAAHYLVEVQIVQHYLGHAHEDLFSLHASVVAPNRHLGTSKEETKKLVITSNVYSEKSSHLQYTALEVFSEGQGLLVHGFQGLPRYCCFRLGDALLAVHQVNFDVGS